MGRGGAPAREISFVSLGAYGPKVSESALAKGVYSFWNQAGSQLEGSLLYSQSTDLNVNLIKG